jgi:hypothetical protein
MALALALFGAVLCAGVVRSMSGPVDAATPSTGITHTPGARHTPGVHHTPSAPGLHTPPGATPVATTTSTPSATSAPGATHTPRATHSPGSVPASTGSGGTATTLSAAPTAASAGQRVILTATVAANGGVPIGSITFSDGGTALAGGTHPLPAGKGSVSFGITTLSPGTHSLTATYNGSATFASSQSAPVIVTIGTSGLTPSQVTLSVSPMLQASGQPVTLTAQVTGDGITAPTGQIQFSAGSSVLSTHPLNKGGATVSVTNLPAGADSIIATYTGDTTYAPATSPAGFVIINPTAGDKFVAHAYSDLFGVPADSPGLVYWGSQVDQGLPHDHVALALTQTQNYRDAVVSQLYINVLKRPADALGLQAWSNYLAAGNTPEQVAASMVGSAEYFNSPQFGNGDKDTFITAAYQSLLGRTPDGAGAGHWHNFMEAGGTPLQVAGRFSTSLEWSEITVIGDYLRFHYGPPDSGGLTYWANALQSGMTDTQLAAALLGTDAYNGWAQAN